MRLSNDVRGGVRFEVTFGNIDRQAEFRESESLRVQLNDGFVNDGTTDVSEKVARKRNVIILFIIYYYLRHYLILVFFCIIIL